MNIGLALSGGGFRAAGFHLGVLARLAEEERLEDVAMLSTVSGGSLITGLIYALNEFKWPTSQDFIQRIVPKARQIMTSVNLQAELIGLAVLPEGFFGTRADELSGLLRKHWGVTAKLSDLAHEPRWMINATCYETGKNWRFERFRMGDYRFGYSRDTHTVPLSDALAASAGFPVLIGPLILDTSPYTWFKYSDRLDGVREPSAPDAEATRGTSPISPAFRELHLWDGGVYDNHGLEALHNFVGGWREGIDFLIVSDAAGRPKPQEYSATKALLRLTTDIMMDQVRSLRSRAILERLINHRDESRGSFLQIGNTCQYVLEAAEKEDEIPNLCPDCLDWKECDSAATMETEIRQLTLDESELLFRHGFEVADYTLYAYNEDMFHYVGYKTSQ